MLAGHTEEEVNLVNAPSLAEERGIEVAETKELVARDFTDLVRITVGGARVVGTTLGQRHRPHLLEAWGQRFNLQLDDAHFALFRYSDLPGMVGRVGTSSASTASTSPRPRSAATPPKRRRGSDRSGRTSPEQLTRRTAGQLPAGTTLGARSPPRSVRAATARRTMRPPRERSSDGLTATSR